MAFIGKNTIENLTTAMYEDLRIIYREYIQNSADSIDHAIEYGLITQDEALINIEIDKKKKLNNKIIIKSKNQLLDDNKKLQEENEHLKSMNYQYKTRYNDLKEKNDYLIYHLNKIIARCKMKLK